MVEGEKHVGLDELCLDDGGADGQNRLAGEDHGPLRYAPDVAGEAEVREIFEKRLVKEVFAAEEGDVGRGEAEGLDVVDDLFESRGNCVSTAIGDLPEEHVEVGDVVLHGGVEVPASHGDLVEVAKERETVFVVFHSGIRDGRHRPFLVCSASTVFCAKTAGSRAFLGFDVQSSYVFRGTAGVLCVRYAYLPRITRYRAAQASSSKARMSILASSARTLSNSGWVRGWRGVNTVQQSS